MMIFPGLILGPSTVIVVHQYMYDEGLKLPIFEESLLASKLRVVQNL